MVSLCDEILDRANLARAAFRHPTIDDLGGELSIVSHSAELVGSAVAGVSATALAEAWPVLTDQRGALEFIGQSFASCGEAMVAEVADAILMLPPAQTIGVAHVLIDSSTNRSDEDKASHADGLLVSLASTGVLGWPVVLDCVFSADLSTLSTSNQQRAARTAMRVALAHIGAAQQAQLFLLELCSHPTASGAGHLALGHIAFTEIDSTLNESDVDQLLATAGAHFDASLAADAENDESRFMATLMSVVRCLRSGSGLDEAADQAVSLGTMTDQLIAFGSGGLVAESVPMSTAAAWTRVAHLAAGVAKSAAASRDRVPAYGVLSAALGAQRLANSIDVGGELWFRTVDHAIRDPELIEAALRILETDQEDPLCAELTEMVERHKQTLGKATAGGGEPATIDQLLDEIVSRLLEDKQTTRASLITEICHNQLLGSPEYEAALERVMQPILADGAIPKETVGSILLVASYVLSYARRKTDATKSFGGFRDLANAAVPEPREQHLQNDIGQFLASTPLGPGWTDERTNTSAGRSDGLLSIRRDRIPFEFKVEPADASPPSLNRYVAQAGRYTGSAAACAFLVVLDTTDESARYNDIAAQSWTVEVPPALPSGRQTYVVTVVIPANMPSPSSLSKKARKRPAKKSPK